MKKRQRKYSLEYKQKAIELSYSRGNVKAVCEELDIPISVLNRWRREHREYGSNSFPGRGIPKLTDEQKRIVELEKALKEAQLERDILKKAVSIFSKSDKRNINL